MSKVVTQNFDQKKTRWLCSCVGGLGGDSDENADSTKNSHRI
jgi:hypothetical protein